MKAPFIEISVVLLEDRLLFLIIRSCSIIKLLLHDLSIFLEYYMPSRKWIIPRSHIKIKIFHYCIEIFYFFNFKMLKKKPCRRNNIVDLVTLAVKYCPGIFPN